MPTIRERVLNLLAEPGYQALKPKALARRLELQDEYAELRRTLKGMVAAGEVEETKRGGICLATVRDQFVGIYRPIRKGGGFVKAKPGQGRPIADTYIAARHAGNAAAGDIVLVKMAKERRGKSRFPEGRIIEIIERSSDKFVGTYSVTGSEAFVRVDGGNFHEPIYVGDPGVKGARPGDKVVFEMLRFPSAEMFGEGVVIEVLGARGEPGVDLVSVIRQFHLPDEFPADVAEEAREQARKHEKQIQAKDRLDLSKATIVTIDPPDAKDFDDAISLDRDEKGFWRLGVHIADVSVFVPQGSALDDEARRRGTSVYLPGRVLPMLPEIISNGLASLQEGRPRYAKSVFMEFDPEGRIVHVELANSVIEVTRRLTYDAVTKYFEKPEAHAERMTTAVRQLLDLMRELAAILRTRRREAGFLELDLPETVLEYDENGRIVGAHYATGDESHRVIEEFMLTANEAVARKLAGVKTPFLRRLHDIPDAEKLKLFAEFVASLGISIEDYRSRFELRRVLKQVATTTQRHAVHYALLRSLKIAVYGPEESGHWALASDCYCHFTSPIRRYPDLTIHRQLDQLMKRGKAGADFAHLVALGEHCSFTEQRAAKAERQLIKMKLLEAMSERVGQEMDMIITGVEEFGFFAQGIEFPAEGLVHVSTLSDDFYTLERKLHALVGRSRGTKFRLGDKVRCIIVKVDQEQFQLDLRLATGEPIAAPRLPAKPVKGRKSRKPKGLGKKKPGNKKGRKR